MKYSTATVLGALATLTNAAHEEGTFAVLRFNGANPLTEGRVDPIVNPGTNSKHYHMIQGGDAFALDVEGNQLLANGKCTTAKIKNDFSNYWVPQLFFHGSDNKFRKVPLFYMNVYYFFEKTHDDLVAFPPGLKILVGDTNQRTPPPNAGIQLDPKKDNFNAIQFTCPADNYNVPAYPVGSDGSTAGMQDPANQGAGVGFPTKKCNGYASPLRQDLHFPSCYNPEAGLNDYKNNMVYSSDAGDGYMDCPEGYIHVPHLFYEVYWNTPEFDDLWEEDGATQPFVFSSGDVTGFGSHADFISGWDESTLQTIIDTCDAGTLGMDTCPQIPGGLSTDNDCTLAPLIKEPTDILTAAIDELFDALPGDQQLSGWSYGEMVDSPSADPTTTAAAPTTTAKAPTTTAVAPTTTAEAPVVVPTTTKPTTTSPAAVETTLPVEVPTAPIFVENPVTTESPEVTQAAPEPSSPPADEVSTVWDIVTVTATTTVYVEPTGAAKRAEHVHLARHKRSGFAARR